MALIQLNRSKTGAAPTKLADGELFVDQLNNKLWWADATGALHSLLLLGAAYTGDVTKAAGSTVTIIVNGAIDVDMAKAREIHRDVIRQSRDPKLVELDIEFQRCVEVGADTSAVVAQKQELRDATAYPPIDDAQTPEELKVAWPPVLEEPTARASTRSTNV